MTWLELTSQEQLDSIVSGSFTKPVVIFKHSTRCSISAMAKYRLDRIEQISDIDFYCLDLIRFRELSNKIADLFQVHHESPQVLLIQNGTCVYDESHGAIDPIEIMNQSGIQA